MNNTSTNNPVFAIGHSTPPTRSILIGSNLTCDESYEIVIGHGDDNCLRLKANGDLYWRGEKVEELTDEIVKEFSQLVRELLQTITKKEL